MEEFLTLLPPPCPAHYPLHPSPSPGLAVNLGGSLPPLSHFFKKGELHLQTASAISPVEDICGKKRGGRNRVCVARSHPCLLVSLLCLSSLTPAQTSSSPLLLDSPPLSLSGSLGCCLLVPISVPLPLLCLPFHPDLTASHFAQEQDSPLSELTGVSVGADGLAQVLREQAL